MCLHSRDHTHKAQNQEKMSVSRNISSRFRGEDDYNIFPRRVTSQCGWLWPLPSVCALLFSQTVHPEEKEWLQSWAKNLTLCLRKQGKDIYILFKQIRQMYCLVQGDFVPCCAGHKKSWLPGDLCMKCSRTNHKGSFPGISFYQLFCLRTSEVS